MKFFSSLFLFGLLLFSCGNSVTETAEMPETTPETAPVVEAPAPPMESGVSLQSTVEAVTSVGGDITALPAGAAVSNINGWITKLSSMDGTDAIVSDLNALKTELTSGSIDGSKVSGILSSLATATRSLEGKAPGLSTLAGALQAGADKLAGM